MVQSKTISRKENERLSKMVLAVCVLLVALVVNVVCSIVFRPELIGATGDGSINQETDRRVLTVATVPVTKQKLYKIERTYLGTVEPRRISRIGFEVPGKLLNVFVKEGVQVHKGQLLAELDVERLEASKNETRAQLIEADAALRLAEATLKRTIGAQKLKAVSIQQLDEAEAGVKQQQARRARVLAQVERIDVDIEKSKLLAPYSGILAARLSDEGVVLSAGQAVFEVRETCLSEIHIGVNREQLAQLTPGSVVTGVIRGQKVELDVDRILPGRQSLTRVVELIAVPRDKTLTLREGDLVEISISDDVHHPGFWLPISALTENGRGLWSCLIAAPIPQNSEEQDGIYLLSRRDIEIISLEENRIYVTGNVSATDSVVVDGLHRVVPNQKVRITQSKQSFGPDLVLSK